MSEGGRGGRGVITVWRNENNSRETRAAARDLYSNRRTARLQSLSTFHNHPPFAWHNRGIDILWSANNNKLCRYNAVSEVYTKVYGGGGLTSIPKKAEGLEVAQHQSLSAHYISLSILSDVRVDLFRPIHSRLVGRECRRVKRALEAIYGNWAIIYARINRRARRHVEHRKTARRAYRELILETFFERGK